MRNENKLSLIELKFTGHAKDPFTKTIKRYMETHEGVTFIDLLKFLYQSALGPFHIFDMMGENDIKNWIERNLENVTPSEEPVIEKLYGKEWARISLGAFKKKYGNAYQRLFNIFMEAQKMKKGSINRFLRLQDMLIEIIREGSIESKVHKPNLLKLIDDFARSHKEKGYPPIHHSKLYEQKNKSEYLVVSTLKFTKLIDRKEN